MIKEVQGERLGGYSGESRASVSEAEEETAFNVKLERVTQPWTVTDPAQVMLDKIKHVSDQGTKNMTRNV